MSNSLNAFGEPFVSMSGQGSIINSNEEPDRLATTSKSDSTGNVTNSVEPVNPELSFNRRINPLDESLWSENLPGCSLNHTENRRSWPLTKQNGNNSRSEKLIVIIPEIDQWGELLGIARKISEIVMDRPVNYRWMFSTDVAISREAPPCSEEGKLLYYRFIKLFKNNCSQDLVKCIYEKLRNVIREEKSKEKINHFLALFWKRVVREIEKILHLEVFQRDYTMLLVDILGLLEEDDIHSCIQKLLSITTRTKDFKFLFTGLSFSDLENKRFPLTTDPEKVLRKLLELLTISSPETTVRQFYDKLIAATRQEEKFEYGKKRLIFFWKRILCVIETKFELGEAELSERLLTEMTKILDETFDGEKLSDIVIRIIKSVDTLEYSFEWTWIFQKKISLAQTTDDDDSRSAFCKFIQRLQLSQGEETVGQFCDELNREISKELVPKVTRKRLLVFWNRVSCLIKDGFHPGEAEFSDKLLNEIRKTLVATFKEGSLLACIINKILRILKKSKQLVTFDNIFSPDSDAICQLADEKDLRLAYGDFILILKMDSSREEAEKFMGLLHKSIKNFSGDVRKLCVIFWKRVFSFVEQVSFKENNDDESELMDMLLEILNDTFNGVDISNLCANILENMEGCRNQHTLQQLFPRNVTKHKPPCEESNGSDYYKFIQRLKSTPSKENVQSFCDQLYDNISKEKITVILPTLLMIFWIKVQCLIEDQFSAIKFDFEQNLLPEMMKIVNDTFRGDNWLTKYSVSQVGCNGFRIQCAAWVYEWYYKRFYRNSVWLREHHLNIAKFDKCCYLTCIIVDIAIYIIKVCTAIFIFIHYFKTHFWND